MDIIIAIFFAVVVLGILRILFYTSSKKIIMFGRNKELNELTNKFPDNKLICNKILKMIGNKTTKIEEEQKKGICLYLVMTDKIILSNMKENFARIQTIAHECIHSMQDKKYLWFNFIFSNLYIIYFVIITILTLVGIIQNTMLHMFMLMLFGFLYYIIRNYLESDAMIKARYLARNYMYHEKILTPEEIEKVIENYDVLNKLGVPVTNYNIAFNVIIKIVIYALAGYFT